MMKPFSCGVSVLVLALALGGCGKVPQTRYYTIDAGLPAAPGSQALPYDIAVARFSAPQVLAQDRLIFRPGSHQVDYYQYRRWSDPPADLVTQALLAHLRRTGLFRSVSTLQGAPRSDYVLRGRVDHLEEVNSDENVSVHVTLALEAVDTKTRAVVWSGSGNYANPVAEHSVEGIVKEINEGVHQNLQQLTTSLASYFRSLPARK